MGLGALGHKQGSVFQCELLFKHFWEKSGQNMLENDFYRRKKLSLVMLHCPLLFSCKARALKVAVGILS